nr:15496_t:CDS:2 [Entrophospora candida]
MKRDLCKHVANQRVHGQYANMNSSRSDTANSNIRSCQPIEGDYPIWYVYNYSCSANNNKYFDYDTYTVKVYNQLQPIVGT